MTIMVRRLDEATFEVVNGHHRLSLGLAVGGKVPVLDAETGETLDVQLVEGKMVVLDQGASASAARQATQVIKRAMSS